MLYHGTVAALYPGGQLLDGYAIDTRCFVVFGTIFWQLQTLESGLFYRDEKSR
jgi:hypothetical protein